MSRSDAEALDREDPLRGFRDRFLLPAGAPIYMDGNSLGPLPSAVPDVVEEVLHAQWGEGLVTSWEEWIDLPARIGSLIGGVIGAEPEEVVISDSTSVNLYKLARAAASAQPDRTALVVVEGEFPTDRYLMEGIAAERGLDMRVASLEPHEPAAPSHLEAVLDEDVAVVVLSLVSYRSAAIADLAGITSAAHEVGALVVWDLSHAAGAIPIDLIGAGADLAVGCTYKYLNGGPGSPAFLWVRSDLQGELRQPLWGWFGHADQFGFEPSFSPAPGLSRFQVGTPPILSMAAAEPGIRMVAGAGLEAIRAKSMAATAMMVRHHDAHLAPLGVGLASPRHPGHRGSHLALRHPDGLAITRWLRTSRSVIADFRAPDTIRMAVSPLVTRFTEAWDAMDALRDAVESGEYHTVDGSGRVT